MNLLRFPLLAVLLLSPSYSQLTPTDTGLTCKPGKYNNGNLCLRCPAGTISTKSNTFQCQKCPPARYPNYKRTRCVPCKAGFRITPYGDCTPCEMGSFSKRANATSCTHCPPDKPYTPFPRSTKAGVCFGCSAGSYLFYDAGGFACEPCNQGSYQPHRNRERCMPCPKGTTTEKFLPRSRADCVPCPPGTQAMPGSTYRGCEPCPLDTYAPFAGLVNCLKCPAGSTSSEDRLRCTPTCDPKKDAACKACLPGQMLGEKRKSDGKKQCQRCSNDTYNPTWSSTVCARCKNKRTLPNAARTACICKNRFVRSSPDSEFCQECPKGSTRVDEFTCTCPPGKVYDAASVACSCPPNYKQRNNGTCVKCTATQLQRARKNNDPYLCNLCREGHVYSEKENKCFACERGTTSKPGDKKCTECTLTHIADDGKKSCGCPPGHEFKRGKCIICKIGTAYNAFRGRCDDCSSNEFSDEDGLDGCKECPAGQQYSYKRRLTECPPPCAPNAVGEGGGCRCLEGFKQVGTRNNFTCTKCPEGFESDGSRRKCVCKVGLKKVGSKCMPCKAGTFGQYSGSGCAKCPRNSISEGGGAFCTKCKEGTFSIIRGGSKCRRCPVGWFVTKNATCRRCASGFRVRMGTCVKCLKGFISGGGNVAFCTPCEKGKVPDANGSRCISLSM